jgi:glycosyltransferase involved in cell wall biosynthesis
MRKKIILAITKGEWGGAQKYVYDLATSLPPEDWEVIVLAGAGAALPQKLAETNIKTIQVETLGRDINFLSDLKNTLRLRKIFKQEKPDIIHLNSSKIGLLGAIAGRLAGIKNIIFTGHGWAFNEDRTPIQKKLIRFSHILTIALCKKTIAVSKKTKEQIAGPRWIQNKIVVIKNGLEKILFTGKDTARAQIIEKIGVDNLTSHDNPENKTWIGTIAELHKNKGLKYLIEAIHILETKTDDPSTLPLVVIIGEGERREKLQTRINRYHLQNNIFLVGKVPGANSLLKAFDIFSLPSITEALPYALLEAGQAGLPVIATDVGGIPEIIKDMETGILVRPQEPDEIAKAISFMLKNPEKATFFGESLEKTVAAEFSKDRMIQETVALYLEK